jgi:Lhr-like helicase
MRSFTKLRDRWALQVGRFILAFGEIEQQTFVLWRKYYGKEKPASNFKERVSMILGRLKKDPDAAKELSDFLVEAMKLAQKRNAIAHHPMCLQVFQHEHTSELSYEFAISSELAEDYVSAEDLKNLIKEARSLVTRIGKHVFVA